MRKFFFFTFCFSIVFVSNSNGVSLTKKPEYARDLNQSICRLNSHPKSQGAKNKVKETYDQAINFYQEEIDRILMGNDPLKWTKTLDVLETVNALGDEIRFNSSASELICDPKIYTSEIDDAKAKAVVELYQAGEDCLKQNSREKAKEAYFYFVDAGRLSPDFKDVRRKILEARDKATLKVVILPATAFSQNEALEFSTKTFSGTLFYKLRLKFPSNGFISFYTPEEAKRQDLQNPDQVIQIEIFDFEMESKVSHYGGEVLPNPTHVLKLVDGKYVWEKYVGPPNNRITNLKSRSMLFMKSITALKIRSGKNDATLYKENIPWNYQEEVNYELKSGISQTKVSISPDNQIYFDHYSLSLCDQVVYRVSEFLDRHN